MNHISVIIPTIWKANRELIRSLFKLQRDDFVEEIIIIDNDPSKTPNFIKKFDKVKMFPQENNLFFNKSVNLGVELSKNDLCCILNDDVVCDAALFSFVCANYSYMIGSLFFDPRFINQETSEDIFIYQANEWPGHGCAMVFFVKKQYFCEIPNDIIHHFGDNYIFNMNKIMGLGNYIVSGAGMSTSGSASEDNFIKKIIKKDWKEGWPKVNEILKSKL